MLTYAAGTSGQLEVQREVYGALALSRTITTVCETGFGAGNTTLSLGAYMYGRKVLRPLKASSIHGLKASCIHGLKAWCLGVILRVRLGDSMLNWRESRRLRACSGVNSMSLEHA